MNPGASAIRRRAVLAGLGAAGILPGPTRTARAAMSGSVVIGRDGWLFAIYDEVRRADFARQRQVTGVINEAVETMKRGGIQTLLAVTPAKARIYREFLPEDFRFSADGERRYATGIEALRRPGTLVPDLAATLADAHKAQPNELLFFKTDTHWTAAGAEAAAAAVAKEVKAHAGLPPSGRPGAQFGRFTNSMTQRTDLVEMLPEAERAKYPTETYNLRQVMPAQGQAALVEDDGADVAVVGNSYTHPRLGFAAMLSNQLERPVALEWKVYGFSPHRTLLSYFAGEAFRKQRPKLIVWVMHERNMDVAFDDRPVWGQNAMAPQAFLEELRRAVGG